MRGMRRLQLFELEDLSWFPTVWRDGLTDYLRFALETFRIYDVAVPVLADALRGTGERSLVDLCSGAGGGLAGVARGLAERLGYPVTITLTDKYPNARALSALCARSAGTLRYRDTSVDATRVPDELAGARTLFSSFHHFSPDAARAILKSAVEKNVPIGIFEPGDRSVEMAVRIAVTVAGVFALMPFVRPFRPSRLFFTYVVPVLPLALLWDGLVSVGRMYSPPELLELARAAGPGYQWRAGKLRGTLGNPVTYLVGIPR